MIWRDSLEDDFPLGDGTADTSGHIECPWCGETVEIAIDPGSGSRQEYVEDCPVCCQPWRVRVRYTPAGTAEIQVEAGD